MSYTQLLAIIKFYTLNVLFCLTLSFEYTFILFALTVGMFDCSVCVTSANKNCHSG